MHFAASQENDRSPSPKQVRVVPELGPALKRDRILQRVRAAKRRLTSPPGSLARTR